MWMGAAGATAVAGSRSIGSIADVDEMVEDRQSGVHAAVEEGVVADQRKVARRAGRPAARANTPSRGCLRESRLGGHKGGHKDDDDERDDRDDRERKTLHGVLLVVSLLQHLQHRSDNRIAMSPQWTCRQYDCTLPGYIA